MRGQYHRTAVGKGERATVIAMNFVGWLTANLNQECAQQKPRAQGERFGQPAAFLKKP